MDATNVSISLLQLNFYIVTNLINGKHACSLETLKQTSFKTLMIGGSVSNENCYTSAMSWNKNIPNHGENIKQAIVCK